MSLAPTTPSEIIWNETLTEKFDQTENWIAPMK